METTRLCPQCQQPLAADAPSGLCPQCLLKAAAGPPPSASAVGLADDFIDIGDPTEVARKLPQFEILEMLGRGGMGVVYKARQRNLDRIVALKILPPGDATSPDFVARFTREARALAKLNHPNIVNVFEYGETGGLYYIIMEYVDGMNLRQLLQTRRLTAAEALAIVPKICDALEYAHEEGLVHRDIKPENLLLDKKGRVKIADFGLAKLLRREPLDMTLTLSGMALGTLRYMAPEQMDKPETVDHRADLYSLGVVIYEMLTGETPVGRFELPSQKAQVDARLDEIVLHALEKEPARRYQNASEIRTDVENVTSKPQVAPVPKSDAPADASSFIQKAGETFAMRLMPRDATDWLLMLLASLIIGGLFMILPGLGAFLLCTAAGMSALHSTLFGIVVGLGVFFALFCILVGSGSVQSVSVDRFGLTLNRLIGPSRFLPWSSIVQIQAMSRWDAVKTAIWPGFPPRASIFSGAYTHFYRIACVDDCWHFGPKEPEKFLDAVRRLRNMAAPTPGAEKGTDAPEPTAVPAESEAVLRARASWFGRRSERFRTLLPPVLIFLELVFLLGSFAFPSPWFEWTTTYTPHKHGVVGSTSSFGFHPFTFSFCVFVTGWVCAFLSGRFSRIDNLVRYGCLFRELRKDIQRRAKLKIFGCLAASMLLPFLISVLFQVITSGGTPRTVGETYTEFQLWPNSKAYEQLLIDLPFYSQFENGVEHYRRPNEWDMAIGLKTKNSAEPLRMDIEMPSLKASYPWNPGGQYPMNIVLDLDELTKWMANQGKVDVKDEKVKKEAAELMALLKKFSRQAPVEMTEYFAAREELMPDFSFAGWRGWPGKTSSFSSANGGWIMAIYLGSAVICLAFYFVVAIRFQRAAFVLDREVRERGESVLARGPLPRVKFGALPRDIRRRTIRRAVLVAVGLLLLPAFAVFDALWESAQPVPVKQTWHYELKPRPTFEKNDTGNGAQITKPSPLMKHFQEVVLTFTAFGSYVRDGETWFVQPKQFPLEVTFCRPKNFSDKPGEFHEVIPYGKGAPEGETFSFTVELPGLHANMDYISYKESVILDEEELLRWMESTIATTTVRPNDPKSGFASRGFQKPDGTQATLYSLPMSETPELKSLAADLMAFLKKYARSTTTTLNSFQAAAWKIPSLEGHGSSTTFHAESSFKGAAIIPALGAAILIFLALLPLLKRSAVRAALRQGTLDIAPQTPAPAGNEKPGDEKIASENTPGAENTGDNP